jgi:hypothetical protein
MILNKFNFIKIVFYLLIFIFVPIEGKLRLNSFSSDVEPLNNSIRYIALGFESGEVILWDLSVPEITVRDTLESPIIDIAISSYKGIIIASTENGNVVGVNYKGEQSFIESYPPRSPYKLKINDIDISRDGELIYCIGEHQSDIAKGLIINTNGKLKNYYYDKSELEINGIFNRLDLQKKELISVYENGLINVWDVSANEISLKMKNSIQNDISSIDIDRASSRGRLVITYGERIRMYDYDNNKFSREKRLPDKATSVYFLTKEKKSNDFITGHENGTISYWKGSGYSAFKYFDSSDKIHQGPIIGVMATPTKQGSILITTGEDGEVVFTDYLSNDYKQLGRLMLDGNYFESKGFTFSSKF